MLVLMDLSSWIFVEFKLVKELIYHWAKVVDLARTSAATLHTAWPHCGSYGPGFIYGRYDIEVNEVYHWIGLRENLQETMVFTIKYTAFL